MADRKIEKADAEFRGQHALNKSDGGPGIYTFQEEVSLVGPTAGATASHAITYLTTTIPANSVLLKAAMTVLELSNLVNHSISIGSTSDATEARSSGQVATGWSGYATSLEIGTTGGTIGETSAAAWASAVNDETSILIGNADGNNSAGAITTGRVLVTIQYAGSGPPVRNNQVALP